MFTRHYELINMKQRKTIQDMHTWFTQIINELIFSWKNYSYRHNQKKILSILSASWESKVNVVTEARNFDIMTIDYLIGNLKTYELKSFKIVR